MSNQRPGADARRTLRRVLILISVLLAGVCLVIGYPIVRIRIARSRITAYCDAVPVGRPVSLTALARDAEQKGFRTAGPIPDLAPGEPVPADPAHAPKQKLMVIDGWVFARWFCDISVENGIATNKRVSFLD